MNDDRLPLVGILVTAIALWAGCGSKAIPTAAFEGTTITIAIPDNFDVGFGTRLASNPGGAIATPKVFPPFQAASISEEDLQRGELVFRLQDTSSSGAIADVGLPVRWIGRAAPDPAASFLGNAEGRQVVALLDLPFGLVDDDPTDPAKLKSKDFEIMIERYRRDPTNMNNYVLVQQSYFPDNGYPALDWFGWGADDLPARTPPNQRIPIKVYDSELLDANETGTAGYTPLEGWGASHTSGGGTVRTTPFFSANLPFYTPSPEVKLRWDIATPVDRPAAWEATIEFPAQRMAVQDVRIIRSSPGEAVLLWQSDPASDCSGPATGELKLQFADPENTYTGLSVVFAPWNQTDTCWTQPLAESDFSVKPGSLKAFDVDGAAISSPPTILFEGEDLL